MPTYNITIDDTSPLWKYAGKWQDAGDADAGTPNYSRNAFHSTDVPGSNVTLKFNGTAVTVYGSKWFNHNSYVASIDGKEEKFNGFSEERQFQVPLFTAGGLSATNEHTIFLADTSADATKPWFDVDHAVITVGDGHADTYSEIILDDTAANISYSGGWVEGGNGSALKDFYFNSTFHVTNTVGATAKIDFYGNAIFIYGAVSSNHGPYTASLDGAPAEEFFGLSWTFRPQAVLAQWANLPLGPHSVVITHTSKNETQYFDLDSVVVLRSASLSSSALSSSSTSSSASSAFSSLANTATSSNLIGTSSSNSATSSGSATSADVAQTSSAGNAAMSSRKADSGLLLSTILCVFILLTFFNVPSCLFSRSQPRKKRTGANRAGIVASS